PTQTTRTPPAAAGSKPATSRSRAPVHLSECPHRARVVRAIGPYNARDPCRERQDVNETTAGVAKQLAPAHKTAFAVLGAISFCHLLNDMMQSLLPALYPMLKGTYDLSFGQIGFLTFTYQITASLLQPIIGSYTDRKPRPYSLAFGMG